MQALVQLPGGGRQVQSKNRAHPHVHRQVQLIHPAPSHSGTARAQPQQAGLVDLSSSKPHAVCTVPGTATLELQRIIRPAHPSQHKSCCGCTQVIVQMPQQAPNTAVGTYVILGVRMCGRVPVGRSTRCKQHMDAQNVEVWAVKGLPQSQQHLSRDTNAQAALLFSCRTPQELSQFFKLPEAGYQLSVNDHWGAYGTSYEHLLASPTVTKQPLPASKQQDLPIWRKVQARKQAQRRNTQLTGLQVHTQDSPATWE